MQEETLYRVAIGEDVYLGTADEVVAFMMRGEGAPPGDAAAYMTAVAARIGERLAGVGRIDAGDPASFLESLAREGIVSVSVSAEPSTQRVPREEALGDGPVAFGADMDPNEIELDP